MAKRVKDLENFPKEKVYNPNCAMPTAEECIGFNESRSIIGELTVLEPIEPQKLYEAIGYYQSHRFGLPEDIGMTQRLMAENDYKGLAEFLSKRFGTSAVGTGKQDLEQHFNIYIPGCHRCPKCNFQLVSNIISPSSGQITADISTPENCPNDGTEMMAVTWKERCKELADRLEEEIIKKHSPSLGTKEVDVEKLAKYLAQRDIPSKTWDDWSLNQQNWYLKEAIVISAFLRGSND